MRRAWRLCWPRYRALSSMGCLSAWSAWRCLLVPAEFASLSGHSAASGRIGMKALAGILSAVGLVMGLALMGVPAGARQPEAPPSPAAIAAAMEILAMKNASL